MVLLTMTASIVEALERIQRLDPAIDEKSKLCAVGASKEGPGDENTIGHQGVGGETAADEKMDRAVSDIPASAAADLEKQKETNKSVEPSLSNPKTGNPISHGQVIELSQNLKAQGLEPYRLEDLLKGATVYFPPPLPKPEPTSEYKTLMARLRREEEARKYERMTNPPTPMETFSQRFPAASAARAFASSHQTIDASDPDDDGVTYADVDRQMAVILNVLLSIVACAAAIWIAARWWSTPARLALSMSGSALVGIAEVVVYTGYIRRVGEAKGQEKKVKEVKEIVNTWVVGAGNDNDTGWMKEKSILLESKEDDKGMKARKRRKDVS